MAKWLDRLKADPTPWLLEKACPSIRYRTLVEIHGRPESDPEVGALRQEVYAYKPPHTISTQRSDEGLWFNSLDGFEALNLNRKRGPGTTVQFLALLEYGWDREHPIVYQTSQNLLMGLLFGDPGIDLQELKGYCAGDPAVERYFRSRLSLKALGLMCRAGLHDDPGVRHVTGALIGKLAEFFVGDLDAKIYRGTHEREYETSEGLKREVCAVISPDAIYPDHALFLACAFHPTLRQSPKVRAALDHAVDYMFSRPNPETEVVIVGGKVFDRDQDFGLRRLSRADYEERKLVGQLLQDLEFLARCNQLERVPKAVELLEWLLSLQDDDGVFRNEDIIEKTFNRIDYPFFPLEDNWRGKHKKFTDLTFRIFLILSLLDRNTG